MTGQRALLLVLIASITLPALAASRSAAAQSEPAEVQFSSTGVGRVSVEPDFAVVVFSVRAISKTAQGAVADNARNVDALLKSLRAFAGSGDRIETAGFRLTPIAAGFVAVSDVQVRTTRVKDVGQLIDLGVRGGADEVVSIGFGREHTRQATQAAVQQAIAQARESAAAVAAGLGLRSVRILSIEPSVEQPEGAMVLHMTAKAASAESAIQPGHETPRPPQVAPSIQMCAVTLQTSAPFTRSRQPPSPQPALLAVRSSSSRGSHITRF